MSDQEQLSQAVEALIQTHQVYGNECYAVLLVKWDDCTPLRNELVKQRLLAFSDATGSSDLGWLMDDFDDYYYHLIGWDKQQQRIFGAYRMYLPHCRSCANPEREVVSPTLFTFSGEAANVIANGIELGRAFVACPYRRELTGRALLMLWRGIDAVFSKYPFYQYAYGPVTLTNRYSRQSIELIRKFLLSSCKDKLVRDVHPRFRLPWLSDEGCLDHENGSSTMKDLDQVIREQEEKQFGVPVLLKQYASLGAVYSDIGVWPAFDQSYVCLAILAAATANRQILGARGRG
jgi:hypothetical protein